MQDEAGGGAANGEAKQERAEEHGRADEVASQQRERNVERKVRFADAEKKDKEVFTFYKLTLDDVEKGGDLRPFDPSKENEEFMRRAKDETTELDDTPKWPSGMDPYKREGLSILGDLVKITRNARMAGMLER